MNEREYELALPLFWILRDETDDARLERLTFHIQEGDYFPFLATVIGFLKETAERCGNDTQARQQVAYAEDLRKDLIYLHENFTLAPKEKVPYSRRKMVRF